ncbi:hypothetical protein Tco_1523055 [Tanacetum coccineum]
MSPTSDSLCTIPTISLLSPEVPAEDPIAPAILSFTGGGSQPDIESDPAEAEDPRGPSLFTPSIEFPLTPRKLLTARKRVGPFPARRLAWRRVSHRSSDRHSSPDFTLDSSYSGCDASGQSHSGPSTRVASPRLVDPPVRTPQCSEAFMRWRSAPLSTLYLPTTLESSLDLSFERSLDSSSSFAGPSRKRCRSPTTLVPSSTPVLRSIAPALADLPPRKRFRDSYSSEVSKEEHMEIGTADAKTVADLGISERVGAPAEDDIGMGVEVTTSNIREDEEEFEAEASAGGTVEIVVHPLATGDISELARGDAHDLEDTLYDISHYMSEVPLDRITMFETTQRQLVASRERAGLPDMRDRVDSLRRHMALSQEEFRQIRKDRDDTRRRLRRLESLVERRLGFRHSPRMIVFIVYLLVLAKLVLLTMTNTRSKMTPAAIEEMINRRATEALETREANRNIGLGNSNDKGGNNNGNGNGNGGRNGNGNHNKNDRDARLFVRRSGLRRWKQYSISAIAHRIPSQRMKLMAEVYCPRTKIQKMEFELRIEWRSLLEVSRIISRKFASAEPTRLQDAVRMANNLMDQKLKGYAMKNVENKRKFDNNQKGNHGQ